MKQKTKKILLTVFAILMLVSVMSVTAFAAEGDVAGAGNSLSFWRFWRRICAHLTATCSRRLAHVRLSTLARRRFACCGHLHTSTPPKFL